jgi:5'-3' exonuclease
MGIYNFFTWFKNNFSHSITTFPLIRQRDGSISKIDVNIDILMIDLNGIIHNSAQKIYKYGNFKPRPRLLDYNIPKSQEENQNMDIKVYEDITKSLYIIYNKIKPKSKFIVCIDGPAPMAKQYQQRKRRFKNKPSMTERDASEGGNLSMEFDPNCITPGTKFMDDLSKYVGNYLKKLKYREGIEIIFSNEKVPGEGEHSCLEFIRQFNEPKSTSYCIYGVDSDLIMLALSTHLDNFYIFREDLYSNQYLLIDISKVRTNLLDIMNWNYSTNSISNEDNDPFKQFDILLNNKFIDNYAINDFILLCFIVGNDFLPQSPSIEIMTGGIEFMLDIYKKNALEFGHLTYIHEGNVLINTQNIIKFMHKISEYEHDLMLNKFLSRNNYFNDDILESSSFHYLKQVSNSVSPIETHPKDVSECVYDIDIVKYRELYYNKKFKEYESISKICYTYLEGMQWILSYYTKGVPCWDWYYPYHYAPFAYDISKLNWLSNKSQSLHRERSYNSIMDKKSFIYKFNNKSYPVLPFIQLLCVLPPSSSNLLPYPLNNLLTDKKSPLYKYCPEEYEIDLSGKRKEYEGVVNIPMMNVREVTNLYNLYKDKINVDELKRNKFGKVFYY